MRGGIFSGRGRTSGGIAGGNPSGVSRSGSEEIISVSYTRVATGADANPVQAIVGFAGITGKVEAIDIYTSVAAATVYLVRSDGLLTGGTGATPQQPGSVDVADLTKNSSQVNLATQASAATQIQVILHIRVSKA